MDGAIPLVSLLTVLLTSQIAGTQVTLTAYYITDPEVSFPGEEKCMAYSQGIPPFRRCEGDPLTLTDSVTGEGSPLNMDQFIGWSNDKQDRFIIAPDFNMNLLVKQVDIYFYHSPAMGIGLPAISKILFAYSNPEDANSYGPIRFTYANNQYLSQNDSNTTMISVVTTEDYAASFIDPYEFIRFDFNFSSHLINQSLISEIRLFSESVSNVTAGNITFLPDIDVIELDTKDLLSSVRVSCAVANEGLFSWSWTGPNGTALDFSHTSVFMADLTRTSILEIRKLSLSDAGQYTCTASVFDGFEVDPKTDKSSNIDINAQGSVSTTGSLVTSTGEQNVSMICDFSGYLPGAYTITWTGPQGVVMATSDQHTIVNGDGGGQSQSGGDSPGPSILSTLTISTVEEENYGNYTCLMAGNNSAQLMGNVELVEESAVMATPSSTNDVTAEASQIPLIVGVAVGGVLLIATAIVVIILVMVCILSKRKKESSQVMNEDPNFIDAVYEDPDAALADNIRPNVFQNTKIGTAGNVAYSTRLQVLQEKEIDIQQNLAYSAVNRI